MPILLLVLFSLALTTGTTMVMLIVRYTRQRSAEKHGPTPAECTTTHSAFRAPHLFAHSFAPRPSSWLAVRSANSKAVQSALGLHNPKPCSWQEGLISGEKLFIAPPVKGWIIVTGSGLPEPGEDIDACFRFLAGLSRKLGQVQFFHLSRVLNHHAWARVERGKIVRAYAWAGKTLWKQGRRTAAEAELGLTCYGYCDNPSVSPYGQPDLVGQNVDKLPLLAARWSLDPAAIDERFFEQECGVAGEPSLRW